MQRSSRLILPRRDIAIPHRRLARPSVYSSRRSPVMVMQGENAVSTVAQESESGLLADIRWPVQGVWDGQAGTLAAHELVVRSSTSDVPASAITGGNRNCGTPSNNPPWANVFSVVDPASVAYPYSSGVLSIRANDGTTGPAGCGHCAWVDLFPAPQAGAFWAWTYDVRNDVNNTTIDQHPFCLFPVGNIEAVFQKFEDLTAGGNFRPTATWRDPTGDFNNGPGTARDASIAPKSGGGSTNIFLTGGTYYRFQFILAWDTDTLFRLFQRISLLPSAGGTIIANPTDFYWYEPGGENLHAWFDASSSHRFSFKFNATNFRTISFGKGQNQPPQDFLYKRVAGFRAGLVTSTTDFIPGLTA